jgi:predicted PurR-regulated permease PerM
LDDKPGRMASISVVLAAAPYSRQVGTMSEIQRDLTRTTLGVLLIAGLIAASFWVLQPFVPAVIWATMIVVSTWPVMLRLQARLWRRRSLAVLVMTLLLLLIFVVPLSLAVVAIVDNTERFVAWAQSMTTITLPAPPDWLRDIPVVGESATKLWSHVVKQDFEVLSAKIAPYAGVVTRWFIAQIGGIGLIFVQFLTTVIFAAILYAQGETGAQSIRRFGRRLAGERGETVVRLAGQAIRGVAMGVVVTAIVQAGVGGIGLAVSGVPFAAILTAVMFMLCIAQLGPGLVLAPAVIWMYWEGDTSWATVLLVCSLFAVSLDNFLRPILIKRTVHLPLLLIFLGVIGGLIAFGLIGIFVGPVVLAVAYTLLQAWIGEEPQPRDQS